jgi:hypothetical protein
MIKKILSSLIVVHSLMLVSIIAFVMTVFAPSVSAQVIHSTSDFNHLKTGFPLTGAHINVDCETCHVGGIFKGTPTNCAGCHSPGRRVVAPVKPASHMVTNAACETCHSNTVTFLGARFNHIGVQPKACMTCHAGMTGPGKPSGHIQTTLSCDSCHRTSTWLPAGYDHAGALPACITCHNGGTAKGKPANHIITTAACDSCHKSGFTTFMGAIYDHVGVTPGSCGTCHIPGTYGAKSKPSGHIPYTGNDCDSCHVGTGYISFAGSAMNHLLPSVAAMGCSTCHNGSYISQAGFLGGPQAKPANHIATTAQCNSSGCHAGFQTFAGLAFNHATANPPVAGICRTCHNGVQALAPTNSITHTTSPGNTASCDTCHGTANNYTSFAGLSFNHAGVIAGTCGTCHLGQSAGVMTKPQGHIPTTGNGCDSCHKSGYTSFNPGIMGTNHSAVSTFTCVTCHSGGYLSQGTTGALTQPANHIVTSAACNNCHHDASYMSFAGAVYDHSGVTPTTCGTCHIPGTSGAKMKPANHIPTTSNACDACHKSGYASFAGAIINHAAVTIYRCDNCHTNGGYLGSPKLKPSNHIPTTITGSLDCNTCHSSTTAFTTEKMNHNGATTGCKTCHNNGTSYLGNMFKMTLGNHQGSKATDDCSQSGCHRPLGNQGTSWVNWN